MPTIYLALLFAYVMLVAAWLWLEKLQHKARRWAALLAVALAAPIFTVLGGFISTFQNNICFSEVVTTIADLPGTYTRTGNSEALSAMSSLASRLPLRGYETDCNELRNAVELIKHSPRLNR